MSNWISASLFETSDTFGTFQRCYALQTSIDRTSVGLEIENEKGFGRKILNSELQVIQYLYEIGNQRNQADICIIAFESQRPANEGLLPLPISRSLFQIITDEFKLSAEYLTVLSTGIATYLSPFDSGDDSDWEDAKFILQQNKSYSSYSIAWKFDSRTGKTRALIFGAQPWSLKEMFGYIGSMSPIPFEPTLVPNIALELQAKWFSQSAKDCNKKIKKIENTTGMRETPHSAMGANLLTQNWKRLDLVDVVRQLSSVLSRLAFLKLQAETAMDMIEGMKHSVEALQSRLTEKNETSKLKAQSVALSRLEYVRSWHFGIQAQCTYYTERAHAQLQTVCSLIASQDSSIGIEIAKASRDIATESIKDNKIMQRIAETSRDDNKLMLQIAEDSKSMVLIAAKDSATMRVIAAVTIFFLPATFASSFFSMTFFDFLTTNSVHVSSWIWLYVVTTVCLTTVTQIMWSLISKQKEKSLALRVSRQKSP